MAQANIQASTETYTGDFSIPISFDADYNGVDTSIFTLTPLTENGITDVTFEVMGSGNAYNLIFQLPPNVEGSFTIAITGMVTPQGGSSPESVMAAVATVTYDNASTVDANWGTVDYLEDGRIVLPVVFGEDIAYLHETDFTLEKVEGDEPWEVIEDYWLVQRADAGGNVDDRTFYLYFQMLPDKKGKFRVSLTGYVWKTATTIRDDVMIDPIEVAYGYIVPRIVDFDIPAQYAPGTNFDTRLAYNTRVTGLSLNNVQDVFLLEGAAEFMTPTPYKWIGTSPPDFTMAVPDDLTGTNWQILQSPPALPANQRTAENDFDADGFWHGTANEGQYFLIRWLVDAGTVGIFSMTPRIGIGVRGRVN